VGSFIASLVFLVTVVTGGAALAQGADVALVDMVSGDVSYAPRTGTPGKVQPFMKVRDGDRISLAAGAQVRIVFFEAARQERWVGPASFRAGKAAAEAISGKAADTRSLPAGVSQHLAQVPELIQSSRLGGSQLRGGPARRAKAGADQQATLAQARATYASMRQTLSADDLTPELYLYAALYEFLAYDEMQSVVTEMQRKQPGNQDLKALAAWVGRRVSAGASQKDEPRVALVIGNSAYKASPLRNPVNDATDMAAALAELGFKVTLRTDASQRQMKQALREFAQDLRRGGVGLFYFAGHGVQSKGRNFLMPVGADVETEAELEDESVDANLVLSYMDEAQNRVNIVVLDACRNNPYARNFRSASGGLAQMEATKGSFIAFATSPGSVAADGTGRNGVYTEHLLQSLKQPDGDIDKVFRRVAAEVSTMTGGRQVPWVASSLTGDFYFRTPAAADEAKLKQTEQERAQLAQALEDERRRREQDAAAVKQQSEQERAQLAKALEESRKQREKDAELVRAEIEQLRAELQKIRSDAAARTPAPAPAAGPATAAAQATPPVPRTPQANPVEATLATPPPSPPTAAPVTQRLASAAPSIAATGTPAAAGGWKSRMGMLEQLRGQLTYSKAIAVLLGVNAEQDLESLVNYQALLKRMPYDSALALGVNARGFLVWGRGWGFTSADIAAKNSLDRCNARGAEGSCRVVVSNGEFREKEFMESIARLGPARPDLVRHQFMYENLPKDLAIGTKR
jgi:uncharacterized caspase-like protein